MMPIIATWKDVLLAAYPVVLVMYPAVLVNYAVVLVTYSAAVMMLLYEMPLKRSNAIKKNVLLTMNNVFQYAFYTCMLSDINT